MEPEKIVEAAQRGFAEIPVEPELRQAAQTNLERWLRSVLFEPYWPQLTYLAQEEKWPLLLDSFYRMIPFGTGGRRGPVGVGPNRINPYTLSTSVQGHVQYLRERFAGEEELSVVIAWDVRQFHDLRGHYDPQRPNPVFGLSSRDLGHLAARVYAANGIKSYLLSSKEKSYISTPELSFLIRSYRAQGGLNISASHNHPDDNGGKFYNAQGGQDIPPDDQRMSEIVETINEVREMSFAEASEQGLICTIPSERRRQYVELNISLALRDDPEKAVIAYSPLHGTGSTTVGRVLGGAGYPVQMVPSQTAFDGTFADVPYRIPNPEVPSAMDRVVELAEKINADLALATDPDADRLGVSSPDGRGGWRFFSGNEIAVVLAQYCLETLKKQGRLPPTPLLIKTEVTSGLLLRIAKAFGAECVSDLLVGFKYIADVLRQWETKGSYRGVEGSLERFVLGVEESHGLLVTSQIRDKDAAGAALYLAELATRLKAEGSTLYHYLLDIYSQYGYFANLQTSLVMEGAMGLQRIRQLLTRLRKQPPQEIGGFQVVEFFDHQDEGGRFGPFLAETDRSARNVLAFHLENGGRLLLRPSGTEPKSKIYIEVPSPPCPDRAQILTQIAQTNALARKISDEFALHLLASIDIEMPLSGLRVSDLVSVDNKLRFATQTLPQLTDRARQMGPAASAEELNAARSWLKDELTSWGSDPLGLATPGLETHIEQLRQQGEEEATLQTLQLLFAPET